MRRSPFPSKTADIPVEEGGPTLIRSPIVGWTRDEEGVVVPLCPYAMRIDYMTPILEPESLLLTSDGSSPRAKTTVRRQMTLETHTRGSEDDQPR